MNNNVFQRHELKYVVNAAQRRALELGLCEHMIPDSHGESTVCNIYYDTPDFRLIRQSLEKPIYKEKLRVRSYGCVRPDDKVFLELKKKYRGVVYKRRISLTQKQAEDYLSKKTSLPSDMQIGREIEYFCKFYESLEPAVYLCYDRSAYFSNEDKNLRVTFDNNIRWRTEDLSLRASPSGEQLLLPGQSLLEIKSASAMPMWLVEIMTGAKIRQSSFSKYGKAYENIIRDKLNEKGDVFCA